MRDSHNTCKLDKLGCYFFTYKNKIMAINLSKNDVRTKDVHPNVQNLVQNAELFPPAEEIDLTTGKGMWTIKGYRVWADNYLQACKQAEIIEKF